MSFDWTVIVNSIPELLQGARLTILIATAGLIGGLLLGILVGLGRTYGNGPIRLLSGLYVGVIRGTPIVVQVMFIYFALPVVASIRIPAITAAIVTIVINAGAYIAEIVRGAFLSTPRGLEEAGLALGLPRWKVLLYVLAPIAIRRMIPPLGNQFIISLKDTSLFIVIGVGELTRQGQEIMSATFQALEIWTAVALIYLAMIGVLTFALRSVEKRLKPL